MRVAFITESFLPAINGVTNSVLRMLEHLRRTGHDAMVIAPDDPRGVPEAYEGFPVHTMMSMVLPWYDDMRLSAPMTASIEKLLKEFNADVVHLAAPMILGHKGVRAAAQLGLPSVALYQTEVPKYATEYGYPFAEAPLWKHMKHLHNMATMTLAPASYTRDQLIDRGFSRVQVWGRGVDTERFNPAKRNESLRREWAAPGEIVVGYMGRLGAEKQVEDLRVISTIPNTRLVIVGDGPERNELQNYLPTAHFTGMLGGEELPRALASFDIFVHPGELETFGQAIQEAQASGLPTIAPRKGGPIDLIQPSHNGWLYEPGNLHQMRDYVADLAGDASKRAAFGRTARARVENRTWPHICDQLVDYYRQAIKLAGTSRKQMYRPSLWELI